jgi:NitT/TauT family transport system permease protein
VRSPAGNRLLDTALAGVGLALGIAIWEFAGATELFGRTVPPASDVFSYLVDDANRELLLRALSRTASEAAKGFVIGVVGATMLAVVAALVPALRLGVGRLSALVNAAPWVALGPIFAILWRDSTPVIIAALAVFFNCFVAISSGLAAVDPVHENVLGVLGATPVQRLVRLQLPAALPSFVDGLRLAVPAAMLGAVFGEWFGATRGLGILLVSAMQNLRIDQLWAAAVLAAGVSLLGYAVLTAVHSAVKGRFS